MKLIKCPACKKLVSEQADVCLHCGQPIHMHTQVVRVAPRKWSMFEILGTTTLGIGLLVFVTNFVKQGEDLGWGAFLSILGVVMVMGARSGGWWNRT